MTSTNYPPQQQPMTTGQGTVSRAWLRYFLALDQPQAAGGNAPAPTPGTALDFIRINSSGTTYETQTPAQVLQDIGGLSLTEVETLFEPLLDIYEIHYFTYSVVQGDTGRAILMLGSPAIVRLSAGLAQGTKIVVSAGDVSGCLITGDGVSLINGVILGSVELSLGQSAACELMGNGLWSVTFGPIQGAGVPTFYAPPGVAYSRNDDVSQTIDRAYISNGAFPILSAIQLVDGAIHQYLLAEITGTTATDTGSVPTNGTYSGVYVLGQQGIAYGTSYSALLGQNSPQLDGHVLLPYAEFTHASNGAFSFEYMQNYLANGVGASNFIHFGNSNPASSNTGFAIQEAGPGYPVTFMIGTTGGVTSASFTPVASIGNAHVVGVYDGSDIYLYVNGVLEATAVCSGPYIPSSGNIQIGNAPGTPNYGAVIQQCVSFYPFALTAYQISEHYNAVINAAWWSDVQSIAVLNSNGNQTGIANSVMAGQNIALTVSSETLQISSFMTLQQAGTIQNNDMIALNVIGYGATVTNSGHIGTINIPGISLSGTAIYDLEVGAGVGETIVSGKGTLLNTGVLAIGTGTGSISLGSGLTLASNTLSASGGGGGGINFGQLAAPTASQTLLVYPVGASGLTLSAGLPGSSAYAETAPTGAVTITLYKNTTAIGTVNWTGGSNAGTVTFTTAVTFAPGDVLSAKAQSTPDATFANFGVVLVPANASTGTLGVSYAGTIYSTLAAGTGFTLTPSGSVLTGSAAGGGAGALTLITSKTITSGATELDFLGVFTSTYSSFIVEILGYVPTSDTYDLDFQFGNSSGPTWETGTYWYGSLNVSTNYSTPGPYATNYDAEASALIFSSVTIDAFNGATRTAEATFRVRNPTASGLEKHVYGDASYTSATYLGGVINGHFSHGLWTSLTYDSFRLFVSGGTMAQGTVKVYGIV